MGPIFKRLFYQCSGGCIDLSPACVECVLFCLPSSGGGLAPDPRRMGADRGRPAGLPAPQHLSPPLREIRGSRRGRNALRRTSRRPAPSQSLGDVRPITGVMVSRAEGRGCTARLCGSAGAGPGGVERIQCKRTRTQVTRGRIIL